MGQPWLPASSFDGKSTRGIPDNVTKTPAAIAAASTANRFTLKRMSATPRRARSAAAARSKLASSGTGTDSGPMPSRADLAEQHVQAEPERQVGDDADHRRGDGRERARQPAHAAHRLDIGRAGEDPQEARHEGEPERDQRAGQPPASGSSPAAARRRGSRRRPAPGSAARASFRQGRARSASRRAAASDRPPPPAARRRRARHRRRRR